MGNFADMVKKIKNARATGGGNYIQAGRHKLRLKSARSLSDRKGVPMTVVEFEVLETNLDPTANPNHQPGRQVDLVLKSDNDAYFPNLKSLIMALYSTPEDEFNALDDGDLEELFDSIFGESQAAVGKQVIADAVMVTAKKIKEGQTKPGEYTRIRWEAVVEEAPAEVAA